MANQYCTLRLGGHLFGVPVETFQEVLHQQELTPVPLSSKDVRGLIDWRGQLAIPIDLRRRMGLPVQDETSAVTNVVIHTQEGATSLLVDEIGDVLEPHHDLFEAPSATVPAPVLDLVIAVCKLKNDLMSVLDTDQAVVVEGMAA